MQKPSWYDSISIGISLLGLVVSGLTAYYALFRSKVSLQTYVVGVYLGSLCSTATVALVNSGTGHVAITDASLHLLSVMTDGQTGGKITSTEIPDCNDKPAQSEAPFIAGEPIVGVSTARAPVVIPPNTMSVITVSSQLSKEMVLNNRASSSVAKFLENRVEIDLKALDASGQRLGARIWPLRVQPGSEPGNLNFSFVPELITLPELK